jgi:hypothetical protein
LFLGSRIDFGKGSRYGSRWGDLLPLVLGLRIDFWQRQQMWLRVGQSAAFWLWV